MKLNFAKYKDKVHACWLGKNIGGTMGAPYEGGREGYLSVEGFATPKGFPVANDDLDLQLVWLYAVECLGIKNINSTTLGEFWLSYVGPHWNEYGIGKANMKSGILPPLSGDYRNDWNNSNGAWIRTEIWACLQPGRPDVAMEYAIEDAVVDHGSGEGTYAAAFVSAMQSSAFIFDDIMDCIDVGLSKIPQDCRVAKTVRLAIDCYKEKKTHREARDIVFDANADLGDGWFEAPSNVGYAVIGLLYGEGDFKKSILCAVNCGDDTDCTGATVGATLGILHGTAGIPKDWMDHIGDGVVSISIITGIPPTSFVKTCTELTDRVVALVRESAKSRLDYTMTNRGDLYGCRYETVEFIDGEDEIPDGIKDLIVAHPRGKEIIQKVIPNTFNVEFLLAKAYVTMVDGVDIVPNGEIRVKINLEANREVYGFIPYNISLRWWLPEGFSVEGKKFITLPSWRMNRSSTVTEEYVIKAGDKVQANNDVVVELNFEGRVAKGYISIPVRG